jgi:hypothetical protein
VRKPPRYIARADLKKMGIRSELWFDDSVKEMELPTSCITLSKHEKDFCEFLKREKVPTCYSMNISRLILFPDLKVAPDVKSHGYHIIPYADDYRWNSEYSTGQCSGGYNELLLFL